MNKNIFFDTQNNSGHYTSTYTSDYGYNIRICIEDVKVDWLTLRFTLGYDQYGGELKASDGGMGGGYTTTANIDKSIINLGVYPLNFKFFERVDLNIGFEFARLINESFSGNNSGWTIDEPNWNENLEDVFDKYSNSTYFGLCVRLAYDINITDKIILSPQYSNYLGLSVEFIEFPTTTRSMRHYFGIGIQKIFN